MCQEQGRLPCRIRRIQLQRPRMNFDPSSPGAATPSTKPASSRCTGSGDFPGSAATATAHDWRALPVGMGRSYGDVCLLKDGTLLQTTGMNRLLAFDPATGVLTAEAGITLAQILDFAVPRGFFLPVTPGTKYVTLGGAIANDIHGKNHHIAGSFGCHVPQLRTRPLRRHAPALLATENPDWYLGHHRRHGPHGPDHAGRSFASSPSSAA